MITTDDLKRIEIPPTDKLSESQKRIWKESGEAHKAAIINAIRGEYTRQDAGED